MNTHQQMQVIICFRVCVSVCVCVCVFVYVCMYVCMYLGEGAEYIQLSLHLHQFITFVSRVSLTLKLINNSLWPCFRSYSLTQHPFTYLTDTGVSAFQQELTLCNKIKDFAMTPPFPHTSSTSPRDTRRSQTRQGSHKRTVPARSPLRMRNIRFEMM